MTVGIGGGNSQDLENGCPFLVLNLLSLARDKDDEV